MSELKVNKLSPESGTTLTLGDAGDTIVNNGTASGFLPTAGSSGNVLTSDGTNWASTAAAGGGFTIKGAPVATTSGTNVDISGFPAGISMLVVGIMGVSCASTVDMQFQMGTASGLVSSGYQAGCAELRDGAYPDSIDSQSSFPINSHYQTESFTYNGQMIVTRMSNSNAWTASWNIYTHYYQESIGAGYLSDLGGEFTQVRFRNGGHAFDAGQVNFAYLL